MTALTEFLIARIAEDETLAADLLERAGAENYGVQIDRGSVLPESTDVVGFGYARVLAECEAKRRIVELADRGFAEGAKRSDASALGFTLIITDVLLALAQVHSDHPDYRVEWFEAK